jgi:hypothetical protein
MHMPPIVLAQQVTRVCAPLAPGEGRWTPALDIRITHLMTGDAVDRPAYCNAGRVRAAIGLVR